MIWKRVSVLIVLPCLLLAALAGSGQNQNRGGPVARLRTARRNRCPGLSDPSVNSAGVDVRSYIIGPNDILHITVFRERDWTGLYPVRTDGMITVALLGEHESRGPDAEAAQKQFTETLKEN